MTDAVDQISETAKEIMSDAKEVIKQRFFSPMYFYFSLAWVITNWKFVYALLFVDSSDVGGDKIEYLTSLYPFKYIWRMQELWLSFLTVVKLLLFPALSAYLFVWCFSKLSEKFYKKNETFKMNKMAIKRELEYEFEVKERKRKIVLQASKTEAESRVRYQENPEFNEHIDNTNEIVFVLDNAFYPSRVLYDGDYDLYIESLNDFENNPAIK